MLKVMIVEDELLARTGLRTLVEWEENGFELAAEATDGKEALAYLREHPVDIVVTDIRMPIMDGLELMSAARAEQMTCEFIVLSGFDDFEFVKKALVLGARDYIHKPIMTPEDIIATLNRVVEEIRRRNQPQAERERQLFNRRQEQLGDWLNSWGKIRTQNKEEMLKDAGGDMQADRMKQTERIFDDMRFVAGAARIFYRESQTKLQECKLRLEAALCDAWDSQLYREGKELGACYHSGDWFFLVRETAFEQEEVEILKEAAAQCAAEMLWFATPYRSPFANLPEILTILCQRAEDAYQREKALAGLGPHVRQAVLMIQENFAENLSLEMLAASIHVNPSYLSRIFQKETGDTFGEYLTERRMKEAKRLLTDTNKTVQQVGEAVGYNNDKYFMNLFKKRMGETPGSYRKVNRNDRKSQNFIPEEKE